MRSLFVAVIFTVGILNITTEAIVKNETSPITPCPSDEVEQIEVPTETPKPTESVTEEPCEEEEEIVSPTPKPTESVTEEPCEEEEETVSPTPKPTESATEEPCEEEEETVSPTPKPTESITEEPYKQEKETVSPTPKPTPTSLPATNAPYKLTPLPTEQSTKIPYGKNNTEKVTPSPKTEIVDGEYYLDCDEPVDPINGTNGTYIICSDETPPTECDGSNGWISVSVEGIEGSFCAKENICVADTIGNCPGPSKGLPHGSYCGTVASGVNGCIAAPPGTYSCDNITPQPSEKSCNNDIIFPRYCNGTDGFLPISVEGVEGSFCVQEKICVAEYDGNCPGPRDGLPYGSVCDRVKTGVLGCVPASPGTFNCSDLVEEPQDVQENTDAKKELIDDDNDYKTFTQSISSSSSGAGSSGSIVGIVAASCAILAIALIAVAYRKRRQIDTSADDITTPAAEETV